MKKISIYSLIIFVSIYFFQGCASSKALNNNQNSNIAVSELSDISQYSENKNTFGKSVIKGVNLFLDGIIIGMVAVFMVMQYMAENKSDNDNDDNIKKDKKWKSNNSKASKIKRGSQIQSSKSV
jgi:hypothetical protein